MSRKKHIAVTGFEAFGRFKTNPASVVVQNLATIEFSTDIQVTTELCVVAYDAATTCSEQLCLKTCPDFIVHVGVAGPWPDTIHLEEESFSHGYCQRDVKGKFACFYVFTARLLVSGFVPFMNCSSTLTDQKTRCTLRTNLDCEAIAAALEPEYPELTITTSTDPGRCVSLN